MAERRMFSKKIIQSARFIKMPLETQALYMHLCLNADDDGVVEAFLAMRNIGVSEDNLKLLIAKNFIKVLNEDLVSFILDWREHNLIRADRKIDSIYKNLLIQIMPEANLLEAKERVDVAKLKQVKANENNMDDKWTTNGQHRIGKDSLVEDRQEKDRTLSHLCKTNIDKENKSFLSFVNKIRTNYKPNPILKIFPRILKVEDKDNNIGYLKVKSNGYLYISFDTKTKDIPASEAEIYWLLIFNNQNQIITLEDQYKQETSQFEIDTDGCNTDEEEICEEVKKMLTVEKF